MSEVVKVTKGELKPVEIIETHVLKQFRTAFHALRNAQTVMKRHDVLLQKANSFLTSEDFMDDGECFKDLLCYRNADALEIALGFIDHMGGQLFAMRETPFPTPKKGHDEPTEEQMERYMERQYKTAARWAAK